VTPFRTIVDSSAHAMTFGSLFSGIGGFDLGLERAGMEVRWQCEIDKAARSVLRRHFPDATLYDDVTTFGGDVEPIDLVCGGFPCQDLSVAGRRAGLAGSRSGLFYEFMRVVDECDPRWVLIENVPGLLSSNGGRDMGAVLGTLEELGYGWAYRVLDAQYHGVAQRRRRVFIVGCHGNAARAAQVLFEPESLPGDPPPSRESRTQTAPCLSARASYDRGDGTEPLVVAHALTACSTATGRLDPTQQDFVVTHALTARHDSSEDGTGRGMPLVVAPAFSKRPGQQIATRQDGLSYAVTTGEPPRVMAVAQDQHGGAGRVAQGMAVRRLTPTECERLQAFPDGWTAEGADGPQADTSRYRQLGNAVCVNVAEWIGHRIMEALTDRRLAQGVLR